MPRDRQSPEYKRTNFIDYLGDFPGARRERDVIVVEVAEGDIDIESDATRALGEVTVTDVAKVDLAEQSVERLDTDVGEALNRSGQLEVVLSDSIDATIDSVLTVEQDSAIDVEDDPYRSLGVVTVDNTVEVDQSAPVPVYSNSPLQTRERTYAVPDISVGTDETFNVPQGEVWRVDDLVVDGTLYVEGELVHFGTLSGNGTIKGNGKITNKE